LYVKSPAWMRKSLSGPLSLLPIEFVYGATYRQYRSAIARSESEPEFVRDFQLCSLRQIIRDCIEKSEFYRERFRETFGGLPDVEDFSLADLERLPVLTRDEVRYEVERLLVVHPSQADVVSTSGSSGTPLRFYLDKDRSVKEWAFITHIWGRIGYHPYHRRAVLRGVFIPNVDSRPWEYDAALRELRLSPFHLTPEIMDKYLQLIQKYRIHFIHGYPSAITILASHALRTGWRPPEHLLGILPISESLFPYQRALMQQAFGQVAIMPFYGLSEKVAIAGEVPGAPDLYEFEPLYGITELVNDLGQPIKTAGIRGRIISTGLLSRAMPLIRYDTGDMGTLVQAPSSENCFRLRVRNIHSRWNQEFLVSNKGALISIAAINIHSPVYACIKEFQFYQDTPGLAVVRVVPMPGYRYEDIQPFLKEIQEKVGRGLVLRLELVEALPMNPRGKRSFIEQRLDIQHYGGAVIEVGA
uniref:hypothetical protein n=1 Tax=uncultured Thermanaerothrix sp. TaxID=1195149 RepID=UPI002629E174